MHLVKQTELTAAKKRIQPLGGLVMLYWTLVFLVVALIAGALGFGAVSGLAATIAKILFFVFLVLFVVSLISGAVRRPAA